MGQISCGCTQQGSDPTCMRGKKLFETASLAYKVLADGTSAFAGDELGQQYTFAHLAYIDHLRGWWEGDVKVQRAMGTWLIYVRLGGRWILHFGTQDENLVREWLQLRCYQRFVGKGEDVIDRLSGFYRNESFQETVEGNAQPLLPEQGGSTSMPAEQKIIPSPSQVDLKIQVAVYIALLVAWMPISPTIVERLFIQRRAANLLRDHGVHVGPSDEQALQELLNEAVQQKERMSLRNTQAVQE